VELIRGFSSKYRRFFNDCANFVSQALIYGGWQNTWHWDRTNKEAWFYYSWYQSYSWAGASNLNNYMWYQVIRGNVVWKYYWWRDLRPGDVLALTMLSANAPADHMMMVTGFAHNEIYVSGHTRDRKNRPWSVDCG